MSHLRISHVSHTHESCSTHECVCFICAGFEGFPPSCHIWMRQDTLCHIWMSHVTLEYTHMCSIRGFFARIHYTECVMLCAHVLVVSSHVMGWLQLVGPLKLQVSFAKEPYKRDYILQKRPIISRSLLIVATPYAHVLVISHIRMGRVTCMNEPCHTRE